MITYVLHYYYLTSISRLLLHFLNNHKAYTLNKIKTTDLGSLFEVVYDVVMLREHNEQEFLNELRCRNGNLTIILAVSPSKIK